MDNQKKILIETIPSLHDGLLSKLPKTSLKEWPWDVEVNPKIYNCYKSWPKITVVTPSYQQGSYIEKTIRSVVLQNYPNIEYIIMDGGSTDYSVEIIKQYDNWISYSECKADNGQSHAINKGFQLANGDIYCWLNSDDYFTKNALYKVAKTAIEKPKYNFFYGWGQSSEMINKKEAIIDYKPRTQFKRHIRIPGLVQPSCFWRKEIHEPIWEDLVCSMDYELWVRLLLKAKSYYIREFLSVATVHAAAKTQHQIYKKYWQADHEKIIDRHGAFTAFSWKQINFEVRILNYIERLIGRV